MPVFEGFHRPVTAIRFKGTKMTSIENFDQLAKRIKAGDEEAISKFVASFGETLRRYFVGKGLGPTQAEDLAVSCVGDIVLRIDQFQAKSANDGSFKSWCYTLAKNKMTDGLRKIQKEGMVSFDPFSKFFWKGDDEAEFSPSQLVLMSAVADGLSALSATDSEVLLLRYADKHNSFSDIGEMLGIQKGTARTRHHRALERLGKILEESDVVRKLLGKLKD